MNWWFLGFFNIYFKRNSPVLKWFQFYSVYVQDYIDFIFYINTYFNYIHFLYISLRY